MATAAHVVALARADVGYTEQGGPHGNDGNLTKFGRWFGYDGVAWCAMFLSYKFFEAGMQITGGQSPKGFASCELWLEWAKKMGTFVRTGRGGFLVGDVGFAQFDKDAAADHVFLISGTKPKSVLTVEGNTSPSNKGSQSNGGGVYERERALSLIIGVWRPPYQQAPAPPVTPAKAVPPWPGRYLTLASPHVRGADVKALQKRLNTFGGTPLVVDGDFGRTTFDRVRWWQAMKHLTADGAVGPTTWAAFFS